MRHPVHTQVSNKTSDLKTYLEDMIPSAFEEGSSVLFSGPNLSMEGNVSEEDEPMKVERPFNSI